MNEREKEKKEKTKLQKQLGQHLVKLREAKGLTAAELARLCYLERSSIARLETGRTNPSLFIIKKLAVGLGVDLEEFFKGFK